MKEIIEYIGSVLNIKIDNRLVIDDITTELKSIGDIVDYKNFLKKNMNHIHTQYMTGFQKFIKLTEIYKRQLALESSSDRISNADDFAKKLASKVKSVAKEIEENSYLDYDNFISSGEPYFSDYERKQIDKIGGLQTAIRLQKSVSGTDALEERLRSQSVSIVIRDALKKPDKQKSLSMVKDAANATRIAK